jgi:hypothetical protein
LARLSLAIDIRSSYRGAGVVATRDQAARELGYRTLVLSQKQDDKFVEAARQLGADIGADIDEGPRQVTGSTAANALFYPLGLFGKLVVVLSNCEKRVPTKSRCWATA